MAFKVNSPNVRYSDKNIEADYKYEATDVSVDGANITVKKLIESDSNRILNTISFLKKILKIR